MGRDVDSNARGVRWWPLIPILGAVALALTWIWGFYGEQRQSRVLATITVAAGAVLLLLVWLVLLSRLRPRTRLLSVVALAALVVGLALSVERRGVSGDVVPQLAWRWTQEGPGQARPESGGATTADGRALAGAWPQFNGPERNGRVAGDLLAGDWTDWERHPPKELWRRPIGVGWSGFAVVGPYAVTQEQREEDELVTCYDRLTGRILWVSEQETRHDDPLGGAGPRATPTIEDGRVFAVGATGRLDALDLATGRRLWSVDVIADTGASPPAYGVAASPLVVDGNVVVGAGGPAGRSLVAYRVEDGTPVWSAGADPAAYSSPVLLRLAGIEQIVWLNEVHLASHDPTDGSILWSVDWPNGTERVTQPIAVGDATVFVSTGYGVGGKLFRVARGADDAPGVELVWESRSLKSKFANVVLSDGYLYGLDDGILACVDPNDGRRVWKGGRYGHGRMILVGEVLLIQAESGEVVLVRATPAGHEELTRLDALGGKTWNSPALAGRHLLVRNDREAVCYELAAAE
jgi:outer membrane protein assembly factor BamB